MIRVTTYVVWEWEKPLSGTYFLYFHIFNTLMHISYFFSLPSPMALRIS